MHGLDDVSVEVHLQEVPRPLVDHETPNDRVAVVADIADDLRVVVTLDEPLDREIESELLEGLALVECKRMVHVKSDGPDGLHAQVAVRVDPLCRRNVALAGEKVGKRSLDRICVGRISGFGHGPLRSGRARARETRLQMHGINTRRITRVRNR
jgi:hypothetical protein